MIRSIYFLKIKATMPSENAQNSTLEALARASLHAADYVKNIKDRRVSPDQGSIAALSEFDEELPQKGLDAIQVLDQLHACGSPATTATTGGRFFGLVVGGSTPAAMGAADLAASWDQVAILEATAPSAVYIERVAGRWILDLLGLPSACSVGFTTGSSVANLTALAAARDAQYRKLGISLTELGLAGVQPLRIVVSEQSHITVHKALGLLGIGKNQIFRVPCDSQGRMLPDAMPPMDADTVVCLQAGNVNSGASDSFLEIIPKAQEAGAWVHVDGAFGLWAAASPDKRALVAGVQLADSWAVDAHKWLNTPYDCGLAICRDSSAVHAVMTTQAPYLAVGQHASPKDMVPEFSRRARGVEVWAAIKEMGRDGVAQLIDRCCAHSRRLSLGLGKMGYEVLNDVVLNQVVAAIGTPAQIAKIVASVQREGECWFGATIWQGRHAIRLSVSSWATSESDIDRTLAAIARATREAGCNKVD
jgi:glutamate/tyrosine decarboxylase-like PLP-dependent enzyme